MGTLSILAFVFLVPGVAVVFFARWIVEKYGYYNRIACEYEAEMNEDEVITYKINKAVINIKMAGLLFALPGFILAVIAFR